MNAATIQREDNHEKDPLTVVIPGNRRADRFSRHWRPTRHRPDGPDWPACCRKRIETSTFLQAEPDTLVLTNAGRALINGQTTEKMHIRDHYHQRTAERRRNTVSGKPG